MNEKSSFLFVSNISLLIFSQKFVSKSVFWSKEGASGGRRECNNAFAFSKNNKTIGCEGLGRPLQRQRYLI